MIDHIWVVEVFSDGAWCIADAFLTRDDARRRRTYKFGRRIARIRKYVPA